MAYKRFETEFSITINHYNLESALKEWQERDQKNETVTTKTLKPRKGRYSSKRRRRGRGRKRYNPKSVDPAYKKYSKNKDTLNNVLREAGSKGKVRTREALTDRGVINRNDRLFNPSTRKDDEMKLAIQHVGTDLEYAKYVDEGTHGNEQLERHPDKIAAIPPRRWLKFRFPEDTEYSFLRMVSPQKPRHYIQDAFMRTKGDVSRYLQKNESDYLNLW